MWSWWNAPDVVDVTIVDWFLPVVRAFLFWYSPQNTPPRLRACRLRHACSTLYRYCSPYTCPRGYAHLRARHCHATLPFTVCLANDGCSKPPARTYHTPVFMRACYYLMPLPAFTPAAHDVPTLLPRLPRVLLRLYAVAHTPLPHHTPRRVLAVFNARRRPHRYTRRAGTLFMTRNAYSVLVNSS